MSAFLKNLPVKVLGGRCLSLWGPRSRSFPPALVTHWYEYIYPCTYSHREGGGGWVDEPVRRLEGRQFIRGMDEGIIKTQNPKSRLCWCSIEFIDWRYSQSCWYFRPSFMNYCPSNLSLVHLPHPLPKVKAHCTVYAVQAVCDWEGGGVGLCWRPYFLQKFNTQFPTRIRTYKIATPTQTKTLEGRVAQTDKPLPQNPFALQVNFLDNDIWHCFLSV